MSTLQWRRASDYRMATACGRYVVDRKPDHSKHPAMTYEYTARHLHTPASEQYLGTFETFDLAAEACERDLMQQTQKGNQ